MTELCLSYAIHREAIASFNSKGKYKGSEDKNCLEVRVRVLCLRINICRPGDAPEYPAATSGKAGLPYVCSNGGSGPSRDHAVGRRRCSVAVMASGLTSYFDRKPSSSIRPGLSHLQQDPNSPHTPQRTFSSAFSSPSISYRNEEESLVFEFGSRHLSAGFAGETSPKCTLGFGPEESRRVGDYGRWLPGYKRIVRKQKEEDWGREHELWRMDLREVDLGLVKDKIERAVREVYTKYLLMDQKPRRLLLVLPSVMPHQLLSSILSAIFLNFQYPSITLFSTPIINTAAAGCRSSLVVDIGWAETVVTAIYEYREVYHSRTTRATKRVMLDMLKMLRRYAREQTSDNKEADNLDEATVEADFETVEDITARMAWCPTNEELEQSPIESKALQRDIDRLAIIREDSPDSFDTCNSRQQDQMNTVPSPFAHDRNLNVPFSHFAEPVMTGIFATDRDVHEIDDHEQPVHLLIFKVLLSLPPDVRAVCMSRIIITGGGSNIPGLKTRLLEEVSALVARRGWDPVEGKAADERRRRLKEISHNRQAASRPDGPQKTNESMTDAQNTKPLNLAAAFQEQVHDPIEEKLRRDQVKGTKPTVSGVVRGVETLGAWAGGSLVASLKIKGAVEIERDSFLQHGLAGARKGNEASTAQTRQSLGPTITRAGSKESGWTLGGWA